jgi:hypothetical protein
MSINILLLFPTLRSNLCFSVKNINRQKEQKTKKNNVLRKDNVPPPPMTFPAPAKGGGI